MLGGELIEFLVRLQQRLDLGRLLIHAAPPCGLSRPNRNIRVTSVSRSVVEMVGEAFPPEDEGILVRIAIIATPHPGHRKAKSLVQMSGDLIRASHLEGGA